MIKCILCDYVFCHYGICEKVDLDCLETIEKVLQKQHEESIKEE